MVKMSEEEYLKVTTVLSMSETNFSNSNIANSNFAILNFTNSNSADLQVYKHRIIFYVYLVIQSQVEGQDV